MAPHTQHQRSPNEAVVTPAVSMSELTTAAAALAVVSESAASAAAALDQLARRARHSGMSWAEIALAVGCSRQAAINRWGRIRTGHRECAGQIRLFVSSGEAA